MTLTPKIKRELSAPLQEWLKSHKDGAKRLIDAGISTRGIRWITYGRCTDQFLCKNRKAIETATGLSVDTICVMAIKRELWGNNDKFPGITTRSDMVSELKKAASGRFNEISKILKIDGPGEFERFVSNPSGIWAVRISSSFKALEHLLPAKSVSAPAKAGKDFSFVVEEQPGGSNNSQRTVDSVISMLNSLANIVDTNVDRSSVSERAKINAAYAVAKMLEKLGVTPDVIKGFKEKRGGADTTNLEYILNLMGRK